MPLEPASDGEHGAYVLRDKGSPEGPLALLWWGPPQASDRGRFFRRHECERGQE